MFAKISLMKIIRFRIGLEKENVKTKPKRKELVVKALVPGLQPRYMVIRCMYLLLRAGYVILGKEHVNQSHLISCCVVLIGSSRRRCRRLSDDCLYILSEQMLIGDVRRLHIFRRKIIFSVSVVTHFTMSLV